MSPRCVYCGEPAGAYDEHDECVERSMSDAVEPATKTVAQYTMICDAPGCRRRTGGLDNRPYTRTTTCKRHRPATGYVIQVLADDEQGDDEA